MIKNIQKWLKIEYSKYEENNDLKDFCDKFDEISIKKISFIKSQKAWGLPKKRH